MQLISFRVRGYRNFVDSGEIEVDEEATVLVGKNEAGKSTLLDALWRLQPINEPPNAFDTVENYPRWLKKEHDIRKETGQYPPIEATFRLGEEARQRIEDRFGNGILTGDSFTAARNYDNELVIDAEIDTAEWVRSFADRHPDIWPERDAVSTFDDLQAALDQVEYAIAEADRQLEDDQLDPSGIAEGEEQARLDGDTEQRDVERSANDARRCAHAAAKEALEQGTEDSFVEQIKAALADLVPRFFYFDDVFLLPGTVSISRITDAVNTGNEAGLSDPEVAAARFLRSVSLEPENLDPGNSERLKTELEAISVALTARVQEFWHQNPHVRFQISPENVEGDHPQGGGKTIIDRQLEFRVFDDRHQASTPFTARSTGFRWFVSFLAQFSYYAEGREDVLVLLDEPGVSLHATAQADLLGYVDEQLVPNQQVLYTTHSAWMVPVRKIHRVRTVEEDLGADIPTGATVSGKMLSTDRDTLMPLQAALGYDIAQTLFVGPDSLVVEGISEILYLYEMADLLHAEGREGLDQRWHICPAGSVGRIPAMLGLLGNSVDTTVLIDSPANPTERGRIEERLYDQARLVEIADVIGRGEGDIEDLFDVDDYLGIFNRRFNTSYTDDTLSSSAPRITQRIQADYGHYNHGDVARAWVREHASGRTTLSDTTKDRFERLFKLINATLADIATAQEKNPAVAIFDQQLADGTITQGQYDEFIRKLAAG